MITILDGPLGTELDSRGVKTDDRTWSALAIDTAPETIAAIHRQYADCGATVHTANTFRTKPSYVGHQWRALTNRAVNLARASVPVAHRIAGSLAPSEDCYDPGISPGPQSRAEHRQFATALADAGCDLVLCETFAHVGEAIVAVEESVRTGLETWLALTAGPSANLMQPNQMADGARRAVDAGASAILVNCTPAAQTLPFVQAITEAIPNVPVGAYANSGDVAWQSNRKAFVDAYASDAQRWIDAGATLIGGCCGVTPNHIARLAELYGAPVE